jgi:cytochrome c-type biogenesis protein CcmH/NrfF
MEWIVPIVVALIGGPLVVVVQSLRKENTSQHAEARSLLHEVSAKVDKVDTKLDGHISWHLETK